MKNLTYIVALFFLGWTASASTAKSVLPSVNNYGEAFIFVEGGVEFAVYPNGEFDFYYDPRLATTSVVNISTPRVNISYNAGYNYDAFVQYDDYGAVIQIEHVPVYYDYYGRLIQAGDVIIRYNNAGNIARIGGLNVHYNMFNRPVRYTGFINHYNPRYVYRPWHQYYVRPHANYRVVYYEPYRAYYQPMRYDFVQFNNYYQVNNYYYNKNNFYRPGQKAVAYNYGRRTTSQRDLQSEGRSSQDVGRNNTATTVTKNNSGRTSANVERRNSNSELPGNYSRQASNIERHEAAVRAQRGRNTISTTPAQTRRTEPAVNNRKSSSQPNVEARSTSRRTTSATRAERPQQRQSAISRSTNARSSSVRTQNDTSVRSRNTTARSSEARPSARSGNAGRSSGGRG